MRYTPTNVKGRLMAWIDRHPRTGWYLWLLVLLNYVIDLLQLFG